MTSLGQILAASRARMEQGQQAEPGGWAGALGTAVNSPIGKAIMAPLVALDTPRRAVISTIKEVSDLVGGGSTASLGDWMSQTMDPDYGVGQYVDTDNIWADRLLGFAGDVLLDPMTYVAGSSVLGGVGRSARMTAAAAAVGRGFSDDVVRQTARVGYSALDDTIRAQLRKTGHLIQDAGYRFKLPGMRNGVRLPGTGGAERWTSRRFAGPAPPSTSTCWG